MQNDPTPQIDALRADPDMQEMASSMGVSVDDLLLFREMMLDRFANRLPGPGVRNEQERIAPVLSRSFPHKVKCCSLPTVAGDTKRIVNRARLLPTADLNLRDAGLASVHNVLRLCNLCKELAFGTSTCK
jgi:hypothetical protein